MKELNKEESKVLLSVLQENYKVMSDELRNGACKYEYFGYEFTLMCRSELDEMIEQLEGERNE